MGLFKWFKRDLTSTPRSPYNKSIILDNNIKLSRNESYLKALNKFYKWRQKRLLLAQVELGYFAESPPFKCNDTTTATSNSNNSSVSRIIYEEIELHDEHEQYDSMETTRASGDQLAVTHSDYENNSYQYNYAKKNYRPLQITDVHDESQLPEYAQPFEMGDNDFNANIFENTFKSDTDSEKYYSVYQEESKKHLLITDLDNSQGTVTSNKSCNSKSCDSNDFLLLSALKNLTDLMVCNRDHVKAIKSVRSDGMFQQGEICAFEISFVSIDAQHNEATQNNMETLRQLRHPNILLLMGITLDDKSRIDSIIYEPVKCSLHESIHNQQKTPLAVETCLKYTKQLISAVSYLHKMEFIHTNVCSQNVLLIPTMDAVKLGGFELSCRGDPKQMSEMQMSPFHVEYRKQYTRHNYQAPELLTNSKAYVRPTYQSDIYGVCITLWEMLNGFEPYHQFDYNELVKVFSLKTAYLPNYQEQQQMPFNEMLEKGLQLKWQNRIGDTRALAEHLSRAEELISNEQAGLIKNAACAEGFYERTSTTKRRKGLPKLSNSKSTNIAGHCEMDECVSPVNKSFHFSLKTPDEKNTSKSYNVNIRIKSFNQDSMQANTKTSNVKEKVNKFESLLSPLHKSHDTHSRCHTSWNITANTTELSKSNRTDSVCLEDFYIDDDLPNDCNFGDNIKLSLSSNEEILF